MTELFCGILKTREQALAHLKQVAPVLLAWYDTNARILPWRENKDPYRIWISEIMLQQTRVEAVKPYYERFLAEFPDLRALAEAPIERVLKLWKDWVTTVEPEIYIKRQTKSYRSIPASFHAHQESFVSYPESANIQRGQSPPLLLKNGCLL